MLQLHSAATQTPKAHKVVGVDMMMDRAQKDIHSAGIISGGQGVVNQILPPIWIGLPLNHRQISFVERRIDYTQGEIDALW